MNQKIEVPIQLLDGHSEAILPQYQTEGSAGLDLKSAEETTLEAGKRALISCGFSMALPAGFEAQIRPRSGLAYKKGITVLNSPGTIDCDYRGEVKVLLINHGDEDFKIEKGDRIAQMVIAAYQPINWNVVADLEESERGAGGFGHTGV